MPLLGPQDVQGIMEMLEAVQDAEAKGKLPPGSYDQAVGQMESEFERSGSPPGRSGNDGFTGRIGNPDPVRAPWRGEHDMPGNFERGQHMANSMANDAMLRELMGSSRKRTEEDGPAGTYALARYPGLENAIAGAEMGMAPAGSGSGMPATPGSVAERKRWARIQRMKLGMDRAIGRGEHRGFQRAMKGRGAKQRREAFKHFVRG